MNLFLSFNSTLTYIGYIIIAILVLLFMVLIHEFGHYIAGKMLKFKINEFSVGFGPKLFQKNRKNGEKFSLRAIPLGGYCAFEGENEDGTDNPQAFNNQKPWKRLIVLFFGAFFNFLSAIIFSFVLLLSAGYDYVKVNKVETDSINYGIVREGDVILGVDNEQIDFVHDLSFNILVTNYLEENYKKVDDLTGLESHTKNGKTYYLEQVIIPLNVRRGKDKILLDDAKINAVYNSDKKLEGWTLCKSFDETSEFGITSYKYSFGEALVQCVPFTFKWAWKILVIFGQLITGQLALTSLGGPVTTISMIATYTQTSGAYLLILLPVIAVNLAVFNLLPIPALDGFQMVFTLIEMIRKKPVKREVVNMINNIGLLVLFGFVILVDIIHFVV